jgi:acyl-CoA thioester hydrolase
VANFEIAFTNHESSVPAQGNRQALLPPCRLEQTVRIYLEDTDAGGIVYHASWLRFFERARTDWLRSIGFEQSSLSQSDGLNFVVRDMQIGFLKPGRLDQLVRTRLHLLEARKASLLVLQQASCNASGQLLAQATVRIAAIRVGETRPVGLPKNLLDRIEHRSPYNSPN